MLRGQLHSEETKQKISIKNKGRKLSNEAKQKIGNASRGRVGYRHTEEAKQKISVANSGSVRSEETRKRMSESAKGKRKTDEHRKNISNALKGRKLTEQTKQKMHDAQCGEKSHMWKGGKSFEPYCVKFNNEFKERVRNFFGRKCVECGKMEKDNGKKLSVHHVNFNKQTCCDDTIPLFVPLCASCHSKTNTNRDYWEKHFITMIDEQYGGKCYTEKEKAASRGER
jgi:hypothetical protein